MAEIRVCSVDDVKPGSAKRFDVGGHRLAVVRIGDDGWYVIGDQCTHAEASIAEGEIWPEECEIECPKHGSMFSLKTGEAVTMPATEPVPVYDVRVDGDDVIVQTP
jgi:3-phenylpropionate/trans-cinnamate dioxygenase ferredoxin subunit